LAAVFRSHFICRFSPSKKQQVSDGAFIGLLAIPELRNRSGDVEHFARPGASSHKWGCGLTQLKHKNTAPNFDEKHR
jgi:hypothetical protein